MTARLLFILTLLSIAGCGGGAVNILPEPFTRERADGKIPVKTELIRQQVRAELAGMPEGEAEVARWQQIETDYHSCRLSSGKAEKAAEQVFANCMANLGYVYMYPIDAEQLHSDIEFEITKERDQRIAAERKAKEERIAAQRKAEEERIAAEKKRQEEQEKARRQKTLNDALVAAVRSGNSAEEARLIAQGANPKLAENEHKRIASERKAKEERIAAARKAEKERARKQKELNDALVIMLNVGGDEDDYIAKMEHLIEKGADVNTKYRLDMTPLHFAAGGGHTEFANFLIKYGADIDAKQEYGFTPLHMAAFNGETQTALVLMIAGANIEAKDNFGWTPLHQAASHGEIEIAEILIRAGADVDAKDNDGWTPLHKAAFEGRTEIVTVLTFTRTDINAKDKNDDTPLHFAAWMGYTAIVHTLIRVGANLFARNDTGDTPLDKAIRHHGEDSHIVRMLREAMKKQGN